MILNWRELEKIFALLNQIRETPHFVVHFADRLHARRHGVHDLSLIDAHADSLETAWEKLAALRPELVKDLPQQTHVYVYDTRLAGMVERDGKERLLLLPVRHDLPRWKDALQRAQAEAAHEVMHLFNAVRHAPADMKSRWWEWLDEGLAVFAEAWVWPKNTDYYRFLPDWRDYPERPLDDAQARYQTRMFVAYLAARFGVEWLFQVWDGAKADMPLEALCQALIGVMWEQVFADYLRQAYDLNEPSGMLYAPVTHQRFHRRVLTANVEVSDTSLWQREFQLDHLAGRYFRFAWAEGKKLTLRWQKATQTDIPLHAEVWLGGATALSLQPDGTGAWAITLPQDEQVATEAILIVSNVGTRARRANIEVAHDDQCYFSLEACVK